MYLHKELETLTRPEIEKLQLERLQKTVRHCMNSPFYKQRFAENHLSPEDIRSLDDLQKIPFTTKQDLRDTYPFGLASVPLEKTVRLHSSSGTTGNPTVILHTQKDLDEWANAVARCLYMVGLRPGDIFQNSSGYGMFTGGQFLGPPFRNSTQLHVSVSNRSFSEFGGRMLPVCLCR